MARLHVEVHYAVDLAAEPQPIGDLCTALVEAGFGSQAHVAAYERDPDAAAVDLRDPAAVHDAVVEKGSARGPQFHALVAQSTPRRAADRRFGEVILRGRAGRTWLGIRFDELVPARPMGDRWLFSNSISCTTETSHIGSVPSHEWLRGLLGHLAASPEALWGAGWDDDEFRASNLHDEVDGMWALGRDVRRALPGLFWLNAFGPPYVDLIGCDTLGSVPASVTHRGPTVVAELYPSPADFATEAGRQARERALAHLGPKYFYDRHAPDRQTSAPDFGLPELPDAGSLEVFTADGTTFTVLPTDT